MKIYKISAFFLFSLLALSACGGDKEQAKAEPKKPEKVVPVAIETLEATDLTETFTLPANLEAWEDLTLSAEIAGPVREIRYQEGERVDAGAVLLVIDPDDIKSSLEREEQNYAITKRKFERYKELAAEGLVSQQELDELKNALTAAEASLRAIRLQLEKCYPKAPVSGIIDRHLVDRGEYVDPGKPLMHLVQVDKLKVIADVPEKDVPFLKIGQEVEIIPAVINDRHAGTLTGTIEQIAYSANEKTRTYRTKIVINNHDGLLRPGMIVRARFVRQKLEHVLSVPLYAVLDRDNDKFVFVEEEGIARIQKVKTGTSVGRRVVIESGLRAGQNLVVKGQQLLIDGAKVKAGEK